MTPCPDCIPRRDFLQSSVAGALFAGYSSLLQDKTLPLRPAKAKSCIVLWMAGGPSHIDTLDPKPGQDTGGPTKAISTAVADIKIAEHMPNLAKIMNKVSLVRGMTHAVGDHQGATFIMQTGHRQAGSIDYPGAGSVVSFETSSRSEVPGYVSIGGRSRGAGFLGAEHFPYDIPSAKTALAELEHTAKGVHRASLLDKVNSRFDADHASENNVKREAFYEKIKKLVDSPFKRAIDLGEEKPQSRQAFGENNFAEGCLLARRLVELGVKFVQVTLGGWDTHRENFSRVPALAKTADQAMAALIRDLDGRGLLSSTMVLWMGEFGRTPRINANNGRDHYPRAFSIAAAGGGIQGGRVSGATDDKGAAVVKDPATVGDLLSTLYGQFGIDISKKYFTQKSGVVRITESGAPIKALVE